MITFSFHALIFCMRIINLAFFALSNLCRLLILLRIFSFLLNESFRFDCCCKFGQLTFFYSIGKTVLPSETFYSSFLGSSSLIASFQTSWRISRTLSDRVDSFIISSLTSIIGRSRLSMDLESIVLYSPIS